MRADDRAPDLAGQSAIPVPANIGGFAVGDIHFAFGVNADIYDTALDGKRGGGRGQRWKID